MRRSRALIPRARIVALAVGLGAFGSLATAAVSHAATGTPLAGTNCVSSDGKISGRGSTLQSYAQQALTAAYASDVCGYVAAETPAQAAADGFNAAVVNGTGGGTCPGPTCIEAGTQAVDPTDPTNVVFPLLGAQPTWKSDYMVAYNSPSAYGSGGTGSTSGRTAISCRTDAFSGTDVPYVLADYEAISGAPGGFSVEKGAAPVGGSNTDCIPTANGWTETPPFTPVADTMVYPNDTGGYVMSFPFAVSAINLAADLKGDAGCPQPGSNQDISTADVLNVLGGIYTNWDQLTTPGFSTCNEVITRVDRNDTSGTTQGLFNYLNDADTAYNAAFSGTPINTCQSGVTFSTMDQEVITAGKNNGTTWPQGGSCSPIIDGPTSGAPALLETLEGTNGGIGYADISDVDADANALADLTTFEVQNASSLTTTPVYEPAKTSSGAANCSTANDSNLPNGSQWVGAPSSQTLTTATANGTGGGSWALDYDGAGATGFDDVAYANQATTDYSICSLTWDFVYDGVDGNTAIPHTTANAGQTATGSNQTLAVASTTGFASSGKLTISLGGGAQESAIATYSGTSGGDEFTHVTYQASPVGATGVAIPTGAAVQQFGVNPQAELTPDQRRTLYSYFTYVFSDAGQAALGPAGYAALPASWVSSIRSNFQADF